MKTILRRLARLEERLPIPAVKEEERLLVQRWNEVTDRWDQLLNAALPLVPFDDQQRILAAVIQVVDTMEGPYGGWLRNLSGGRCRLPELAAVVMKELLLAWLSPAADGGVVCNGCGLEYPQHKSPPLSTWKLLPGKKPQEGPPPWYDLPEFFTACPNCGHSRFDIDWPHLTEQREYAWKNLDGYVGLVSESVTERRGAT